MRHLLIACLFFAALPAPARDRTPARAEANEYEILQVDPKAQSFTGKLNGQMQTFRVRPSVEVTINGVKATFDELEPGMKVKVTSGDPGVATHLTATGIRTRTAPESGKPTMGFAGQPARVFKATIAAADPDGFPIGDVRKDTKISLQYLGGQWKSGGRIAQFSPDDQNLEKVTGGLDHMDANFGDGCRLAIALPASDGNAGDVLAIVPGGTSKAPFVFTAERDYPGLVLRIKGGRSTNPGKVDYNVKILPPAR